ncbi:hypothetical protein [Sinorhizobium meliloti]|uniref:hypothetical protein n=1 Tax=Rhizobium meliloti TaxID=382 RepID=UPI001249DBEF|nr:hypothetical protein [Sinorhizobium meliloti]MDE3767580.1 hypothetical protein [Sinorhizobium meliloti]MDE3779787.1 hypothetical protein [Sinorhizobium meliloti]MDE3807412.1 hypothetical protein [Sinorhizobium meliloti]
MNDIKTKKPVSLAAALISAVLIAVLALTGLIYFRMHAKFDELSLAATTRCKHDPKSNTTTTLLEQTRITVPTGYVLTCESGAPTSLDSWDNPTPHLRIRAVLPTLAQAPALGRNEKVDDHIIEMKFEGIPREFQPDSAVTPRTMALEEYKKNNPAGSGGQLTSFGMVEYRVSPTKSFYMLKEQNAILAHVTCSQAAKLCSSHDASSIPGISLSLTFPINMLPRIQAIRKNLGEFIDRYVSEK